MKGKNVVAYGRLPSHTPTPASAVFLNEVGNFS